MYVKYTKSSQSKILKSCSIVNIGFNQPKKANNAFQGNLCFPLFLLQLCANTDKVLSDQCTKHFRRCKSCARNPAFRRTFIAMATACSPGSNSETTCDTLMRDGQTPRRAHCSTSGTVTHMPVSTCRNARDKAGGFMTVHRALRLPAYKRLHLGEKIPFTLLNKFRLLKGQKVYYH